MAGPQDSRLLSLAPELRNRIYELVLIKDSPIVKTGPTSNAKKAKTRQPPLTRTCREIRRETLPVFYGQNTFMISARDNKLWFEDWRAWFKEIREHVRLIHHFQLNAASRDPDVLIVEARCTISVQAWQEENGQPMESCSLVRKLEDGGEVAAMREIIDMAANGGFRVSDYAAVLDGLQA